MPKSLHYVIIDDNPDYYSGRLTSPDDSRNGVRMRFKLAHYRNEKKLTQEQVATAIGISQGLYNQLESGKRRMNETYLEALADLYKVSPKQLIVDPVTDDPLYDQLDAAYRLLSPAERKILVDSAKGIAAASLEAKQPQ